MKKKTKFGGTSILENIELFKNINKKGIYIADDIDYNIRQHKKEDLIKKYENVLDEAKQDVIRAKEEKNRKIQDEDIENKRKKNTIEERKLSNNKNQYAVSLSGAFIKNTINFLFKFVKFSLTFLLKLINNIINLVKSTGNGLIKLFNIGGGVIIKTIFLITFIIVCFFAATGAMNPNNNNSKNNLVSTDKNYSSFLINTPKPNTFFGLSSFGLASNFFYNMIPDNYRFQFNFLKNKINSYVGNDIYEIVGTPRQTTNEGINDGIYHIKYENNNNSTYTTLKPKPIEIDLSSIESYPNIDYNKLPENLKKKFDIKTSISIPVTLENNSIWKYDVDKIYYTNNETPITNIYSNYKLPFKNTTNINEFKFNKEKAEIFNDDDKKASAILNKMFEYDNNTNKYIYPEYKK